MNTDLPALKIEIVWFDDNMLELRLGISNAGFAGQAHFYAALNEPKIFAKSIEGFPKDMSDDCVKCYFPGGQESAHPTKLKPVLLIQTLDINK